MTLSSKMKEALNAVAPQNGKPARQTTPCAHTDCSEPATVQVKLPTGWANLCKRHDLFHNQLEADAFCDAQRLVTVAQKRAWIKEKMASFGKLNPAEHWQGVLATPNLPELSYQTARRALKKMGAPAPE